MRVRSIFHVCVQVTYQSISELSLECFSGSIAGDASDEVIQEAEELVTQMLRVGAVEGSREHFNSLGRLLKFKKGYRGWAGSFGAYLMAAL